MPCKLIFFPVVNWISPVAKTFNHTMNSLMSALHYGYCTFAVHHERSLVPAFFKMSIDHLFNNLQSGEIN